MVFLVYNGFLIYIWIIVVYFMFVCFLKVFINFVIIMEVGC